MAPASNASTCNPLTLIMPIRHDVPLKTLLGILQQQNPAIIQALNKIGTVHNARFQVLDASAPNLLPSPKSTGPFKLAVITTYDGDFDDYIEDFVAQLADVFDALVDLTDDGADVTPVKDNISAFAKWVKKNDASQQFPHQKPTQYSAYSHGVQDIKAMFGS